MKLLDSICHICETIGKSKEDKKSREGKDGEKKKKKRIKKKDGKDRDMKRKMKSKDDFIVIDDDDDDECSAVKCLKPTGQLIFVFVIIYDQGMRGYVSLLTLLNVTTFVSR